MCLGFYAGGPPHLPSVSHPLRGREQTFYRTTQVGSSPVPQGSQHHREARPGPQHHHHSCSPNYGPPLPWAPDAGPAFTVLLCSSHPLLTFFLWNLLLTPIFIRLARPGHPQQKVYLPCVLRVRSLVGALIAQHVLPLQDLCQIL